jgi:integrase
LHCSDVLQYGGIWCLDVNDEGEKQLKNKSSKRVVPLHPILSQVLNFPGYAMKQKESGHEKVFHELKKISHAYSHAASKWFNDRYKKQIELTVKEGEKKSFHSFRHSFQNNLKQNLVIPSIIDDLAGHAQQGESMKRYGKPYIPEVLFKEGILKLNFNLDLSHLKSSKWVVR